ncbi:MAG: carbamate kinase [Firmicutes bacterium]|nr:carbamate kinase [Candidatus Fermentithermobacillaceae bacterium]
METAVVALGGNAILQKGDKGTAEDQRRNVERTAEQLVRLVEKGYRLVITHGNGPQVGNILIQNEAARDEVPEMPMDICGAQSQGMIGYMLQMYMHNSLKRRDLDVPVATIVTQTLVDTADPAFANPTKPVGPFCTQEWAEERMKTHSEKWVEDSGRGWRRVVPSPDPISIVELPSIKSLVDKGHIVICTGGGGIPVVRDRNGLLQGVEAVIDKDLGAERLATLVGADNLIILTDVNGAALNYKTPDGRVWLGETTLQEISEFLDQGHFLSGSMAPKVRAIIRFIRNGGKLAVIASLDKVEEAMEGKTGTRLRGYVNNA